MSSASTGMQHLRLVVPQRLAQRVLAYLSAQRSVINVVRFAGAAAKPPGDVIACEVAREDTSVVLDQLKEMGLHQAGSISVLPVEVSVSSAAADAEAATPGFAADAVVWETVEAQTTDAAELNTAFLLFLTLATLIASVGIITDSVVLIIGAMVVGPEFGPLAGVCVAVVQRRLRLALRSFIALAVGFPVAVAVTWLMVIALIHLGVAPPAIAPKQTLFISHPDAFSVIVALLAGIAGTLSLTTAKSSALVGVFISVTTVPAAADIAVAAGYGDTAELSGAALQLAINVLAIIVAGVATLAVQRALWMRRLSRAKRPKRHSAS